MKMIKDLHGDEEEIRQEQKQRELDLIDYHLYLQELGDVDE